MLEDVISVGWRVYLSRLYPELGECPEMDCGFVSSPPRPLFVAHHQDPCVAHHQDPCLLLTAKTYVVAVPLAPFISLEIRIVGVGFHGVIALCLPQPQIL